ncbi:MAG: PQQ-binding-like beta-propeller repeat protein [Chloroflexi bacterium]|nr:PQQ-binding-like beta-propeller repeat protein [Chloroflexota bacterium]MBP8056947.1 PQQ-binding-like beta-propeller repeat protein [Chloroflexota bacterium]
MGKSTRQDAIDLQKMLERCLFWAWHGGSLRLRRYRRPLTLLCLLFTAYLFFTPTPAHSQTISPAYWQYDATGQITSLEVADLNDDNFAEFVLVADGTKITALSSGGQPLWPSSYTAPARILQLQTVDRNGANERGRSIAFVTLSHLSLLDETGNERWTRLMPVTPVSLVIMDYNQDGVDEILVALSSGQLRLYSTTGQLVWRYTGYARPASQPAPLVQIGDTNRDGLPEVAVSYLTSGSYSELALLNTQGTAIWDRAVEGQITALTFTNFDPEQPQDIVVGTDRGRVHYIDSQRNTERWFRTPNKPISALQMAPLDGIPHLLVGTTVGRLIAYTSSGRTFWDNQLAPTPEQGVVTISPNPTTEVQPIALAVTLAAGEEPLLTTATEASPVLPPLGPDDLAENEANPNITDLAPAPTREDILLNADDLTATEPAHLLLLSNEGRILSTNFTTTSFTGLSRLVDINQDGREELLLAGYGSLELLDPGFGPGRNQELWNFRLDTRPQTALVLDVEDDGQEELLIGTEGGILYLIESNSGNRRWFTEMDGIIWQTALAYTDSKRQPGLVVVYNQSRTNPRGVQSYTGHITVLRPNDGQPDPVWGAGIQLPVFITSLLIADINEEGRPEILIGTIDGQILAYSLTGERLWQTSLTGRVDQLLWFDLNRGDRRELVAITQSNLLHFLSNKGLPKNQLAYLQNVVNLQTLTPEGLPPSQLIVTGQDGIIQGLGAEGRSLWEYQSNRTPINSFVGGNSLYVVTEEGDLIRLAYVNEPSPSETWRLTEPGRITAFYWGDLNGDIVPDIAVGNRDGVVYLYTADERDLWDQLEMAGEIFWLTGIQRQADQPDELVAITETGVVRLFQKQVNRAPLLFNSLAEANEAGYSLNISVINIEENEVVGIRLEVFDPVSNTWVSQGEQTAQRNESLFWLIEPPATTAGVQYRFIYHDDVHSGLVEPMVGPPPLVVQREDRTGMWVLAGVLVTLLVGFGGAFMRRTWQPDVRARRFYRRLLQQPDATLNMIKVAYNLNADAPGFLLGLANQARLEGNPALAGLVDGLFLLTGRPEAGLPIILGALEEGKQMAPIWRDLASWQATFKTAQQLLTAPSITELSLLRPQLGEALRIRGRAERPAMSLDALLPIITRISDSERVEEAGDRLVYLRDAETLLLQLQERVTWQVNRIEKCLVTAITARWLGLVTAATEEIQGQASLEVRLKTRRLVAGDETEVTLEIKNSGRAPAENVIISLAESPAFDRHSPDQTFPFLPPGRGRPISFTIAPRVTDRFRLVCEVIYDDRHRTRKTVEFADMVHLLPPARDFTAIMNPYSPGTPLRRNSPLFVGRERFFHFIAENVRHSEQNRVLIMVGQRRTGKTSALLRLDQHLPENLLVVYIDCQSLGVVEGMAALFYDLAWAIADALATKGFAIEIPDRAVWNENPTHLFQRQFIPSAQALLPPGTTLLLVFDEFEAFQNLVNDGILPPTFFTYLRHLMQHAEGLSFVFVGTHRLEEMSSDYWSVLFNIALHGEIGFLDTAAATRLITEPVSPHLVYDDLALEKILRVTAGHPYFLQLVCYTLVNRANEQKNPYITISDVNATLDQMLSLGEAHFAYLWQQSSQAERALLTAAAHLMDRERPFHPSDLLQYLSKYNIQLTPAEVTIALNRLGQRDILRELGDDATSLYELKIGLVGLWVARNKSLSKLYESNGAERAVKKKAA